MKRLVGALAFSGAMTIASSVMAQEIQISGPLAGAPSCRHCIQYRAGRFTIAPSFGMTIQDEFDRTMFVGATINYHFNDIIALGIYGAYGVIHIPTPLTNQVVGQLDSMSAQGSSDPMVANQYRTANVPGDGMGHSRFYSQVGQLNWILSPQLTVIPLRGKLSLFQNIFIDTDFYVFAGPAFIGVTERAPFTSNTSPGASMDPTTMAPPTVGPGDDNSLETNQIARASRVAVTASFGVGINFYVNHFISLAVEYRAFPFAWNTSGTDESSAAQTCGANSLMACSGFPDSAVSPSRTGGSYGGSGGQFILDSNDQTFHFNQMVNFSVTIFLPTEPRVSE